MSILLFILGGILGSFIWMGSGILAVRLTDKTLGSREQNTLRGRKITHGLEKNGKLVTALTAYGLVSLIAVLIFIASTAVKEKTQIKKRLSNFMLPTSHEIQRQEAEKKARFEELYTAGVEWREAEWNAQDRRIAAEEEFGEESEAAKLIAAEEKMYHDEAERLFTQGRALGDTRTFPKAISPRQIENARQRVAKQRKATKAEIISEKNPTLPWDGPFESREEASCAAKNGYADVELLRNASGSVSRIEYDPKPWLEAYERHCRATGKVVDFTKRAPKVIQSAGGGYYILTDVANNRYKQLMRDD